MLSIIKMKTLVCGILIALYCEFGVKGKYIIKYTSNDTFINTNDGVKNCLYFYTVDFFLKHAMNKSFSLFSSVSSIPLFLFFCGYVNGI